MKNEAKFSDEIRHTIFARGYWTYKIPDDKRGKKPFDRICDIDGNSLALELKASDGNSFSLYKLQHKQNHQIAEMNARKYSFFIINYKYTKKDGDEINIAAVLSAMQIKYAVEHMTSIKLFLPDGRIGFRNIYTLSKGLWQIPFKELILEKTKKEMVHERLTNIYQAG